MAPMLYFPRKGEAPQSPTRSSTNLPTLLKSVPFFYNPRGAEFSNIRKIKGRRPPNHSPHLGIRYYFKIYNRHSIHFPFPSRPSPSAKTSGRGYAYPNVIFRHRAVYILNSNPKMDGMDGGKKIPLPPHTHSYKINKTRKRGSINTAEQFFKVLVLI